jgi:hypothetical protein
MWKTRKPRCEVKCCADPSSVVRGAVLLLAASPARADFVPDYLAAAVAIPYRGHRCGWGAGIGVGGCYSTGASFATGLVRHPAAMLVAIRIGVRLSPQLLPLTLAFSATHSNSPCISDSEC